MMVPNEWKNVKEAEVTIEKVWFDDATIWRRGNAPLVNYEPNNLQPGRALDELRFVAGQAAMGYPEVQQQAWVCVCGRANSLDSARCCRCERGRDAVFASFSRENVRQVIAVHEKKLADVATEARKENSRLLEEESKQRRQQRRRKNRVIRWSVAGALALAAVLSGCTFFDSSVEQLFTLPRMAEEYTGLSQQIDSLIDQGYEYASPSGGRNIQSVQMVDLEDDGIQEALVFLRRSSDEKPLKIMVFRLEGDTYRCFCTIESSGSAVDSVYYQDLNGDGCREIIVGWRISADVQTLAAYTVESEPVALMSSGYTQFSVQDLNGDGVPSLLVLRSDGELGPVAEFYGWQEEQMGVSYRCRLSTSMAALNRGSVVTGMVDKDTPAVFITGVDITSMAVTDILIYRQEAGLVNVALDKNSGVSASFSS